MYNEDFSTILIINSSHHTYVECLVSVILIIVQQIVNNLEFCSHFQPPILILLINAFLSSLSSNWLFVVFKGFGKRFYKYFSYLIL